MCVMVKNGVVSVQVVFRVRGNRPRTSRHWPNRINAWRDRQGSAHIQSTVDTHAHIGVLVVAATRDGGMGNHPACGQCSRWLQAHVSARQGTGGILLGAEAPSGIFDVGLVVQLANGLECGFRRAAKAPTREGGDVAENDRRQRVHGDGAGWSWSG